LKSASKLRWRVSDENAAMKSRVKTTESTRSLSARRPSDRRAHRRIASAELPEPALIRIPNRPAVALVDVSSGGALLELPFQMPPESRFTLELTTPDERLAIPFQLLRCYVADLKGGVRYHAAGSFDRQIALPPSLAGGLELSEADRLVSTLESFLRMSQATDPCARDARFNELLSWAVGALRDGEPGQLIARQIRTHLTRLFPSLAISPSTPSIIGDVRTSARFFGFDFRTNKVLTAPDRRFLRASAQLINLIEKNTDRKTEDVKPARLKDAPPSMIVHSIAEWQSIQNVS
jgi:PilZ domain